MKGHVKSLMLLIRQWPLRLNLPAMCCCDAVTLTVSISRPTLYWSSFRQGASSTSSSDSDSDERKFQKRKNKSMTKARNRWVDREYFGNLKAKTFIQSELLLWLMVTVLISSPLMSRRLTWNNLKKVFSLKKLLKSLWQYLYKPMVLLLLFAISRRLLWALLTWIVKHWL